MGDRSDQRHHPPLRPGVALDVAPRHRKACMPGELLDVAQAAAGLDDLRGGAVMKVRPRLCELAVGPLNPQCADPSCGLSGQGLTSVRAQNHAHRGVISSCRQGTSYGRRLKPLPPPLGPGMARSRRREAPY